jgi:DNA (cytosine-5)-methyltransferase 1
MTDAPADLFDAPPVSKPQPRRRQTFREPRRNAARQAPRVAASARERHRRQWPLGLGINVVLFAGMGGACQGMEKAGFPVAVAVNHDEVAIAAHRALNPHTRHIQADILEVDPYAAVGGQRVFQLWGSPDCVDFSVAKGDAPRSPRRRSLPWQMCRWVGVLRKRGLGPEVVYLENVKEIRGWGPLIAKRCKVTGRVVKLDGSVAGKGEVVPVREQALVRDPKRAGMRWRAWLKHMRGLGAHYEDRDLCCANYGIPTTRTRLFGVGHFSGAAPVWPLQTHDRRHRDTVKSGRYLPHVAAATILDWSIPIPSIFDRDKELVVATQRRIAVGTKRHVIDAEKPFLVELTHHGHRSPLDIDEPVPTITGAHRGEMALVAPSLVSTTHRGGAGSDNRTHAGAEALPTLTANVKGGELAVAGAWLVQNNTGVVGHSAEDALSTTVATMGPQGVAAAYLVHQRGTGAPTSAEDSLRTIATGGGRGGDHIHVAAVHLTKFRENSVGGDVADALPTVTANGNSETRPGCAIPLGVVAASMIQVGYGEREGQEPRALDVQEAIGTQVAGGVKHAVTVAHLTEYYGTGGQHQDVGDALNTLPSVDRFSVTSAGLQPPPLTAAQYARARQVAEFLRRYGCWDGGEVVTVGNYILVDIGMRMLKHWEAAKAHNLTMPDSITIQKRDRKGNRLFDAAGAPIMISRPLNKTEAMRLIGNSVPADMAEILSELNAAAAMRALGLMPEMRATA